MMRDSILLLVLTASAAPCLRAQADGCRGAFSTLNRVKEQITPKLSAADPAGKDLLKDMSAALERATRVCKDQPELLYFRKVVSERLGGKDNFADKQLAALNYTPSFNPFSTPPAATPPPPGPGTGKATPVRQKWALVIGVNKFTNPHINALHLAVKDSTDFASFLTDPHGGHFDASRVRVLTNETATLQGIRQGLGWLRANVQPDDLVVIYISSHGSPREMDPNGVSYVITSDTDISSPENLYASSLQMIDLVQTINRDLKARRVVLFLDTCFSGDAQIGMGGTQPGPAGNSQIGTDTGAGAPGASRRVTPMWAVAPPADAPASASFSAAFQNLRIGYGRAVITASRADEESWESEKLGNGYFTHFLLEALRESNGTLSLKDAFAHLRGQVSSRVLAEQKAHQDPSAEFSESADTIILAVPESAPAAAPSDSAAAKGALAATQTASAVPKSKGTKE